MWKVSLVQFDSVPEQAERNLAEMERLARQAAGQGARLVLARANREGREEVLLIDLAIPAAR